MSFGPDFEIKERVRQSTDIVDLVGRYVNLRRQGRNFAGLCPFHDDRHPSMQVNPERQTWRCWVCDLGGDAFSFVMQREGVSFPEALKMLADRAGIVLDQRVPAAVSRQRLDEKQRLYQAMSWAAEQFHRCLIRAPEGEPARSYLMDRGIDPESVERFQIGFAPDSWSWLADRAKSTDHSLSLLEEGGMLERKSSSSHPYDRFRGRLMFPIRDTQDRPIAFGGRILPASEAAFEAKFNRPPAKYINSPETKLYTKSDHLYGLDVVRDAVVKRRQIVIVEGYTDVVMTWQAGLDNVTAVLGTALNERHLRLISRFADQAVLVLDGDEAGQKRTNEVLDLFVAANFDLRILTLPEGLDPCDYVLEHGAENFRGKLETALDALDHKLAVETKGLDLVHDTHRATRALESILESIARAPKVEIRNLAATKLREEALLSKISKRFHISRESLQEQLQKQREQLAKSAIRTSNRQAAQQAHIDRQGFSGQTDNAASMANPEPPLADLSRFERHEIDLLEILILDSEKIDEIVQNISPDQFVMGPMRDLYEAICHFYHAGIEFSAIALMTELEDVRQKSLLERLDTRAQEKHSQSTIDFDLWTQDVIHAFQKIESDVESRRLIDEMDTHQLSDEEEEQALKLIFEKKLAEQKQRP